jgi:predicted transcriptional regulator/putative methionine-R-sulfoxide reductase with GAF domain
VLEKNNNFKVQLDFLRKKIDDFKTVEEIAMLTNVILHSEISADKIAFAVVEGELLKSVNVIGHRVFLDLNMDEPSINARAVNTGETQLVNNTRTDEDYYPGNGPYAVEMLSELCVPIIHEENVLGTINLENRSFNSFSLNDAKIVEDLAKEIAPALNRILTNLELDKIPVRTVRSREEIKMDILKAIKNGETNKTKICNAANVSWSPGTKILGELESVGHVTLEHYSKDVKIYIITDLGLRALTEFENLRSLIR